MIRILDMECGCELVHQADADAMRTELEDLDTEYSCPVHGQVKRRVAAQVRPWRGVNKKDRWADVTGQ